MPNQPRTEHPQNCQNYGPGHTMHWVHAKQVGKTPWGWRDGFARTTADVIVVAYAGGGSIEVWHHRRLDFPPGTPVRVHEQFHALAVASLWINVDIRNGGAGAVLEPSIPELWAAEMQAGITSVVEGTGVGLPTSE